MTNQEVIKWIDRKDFAERLYWLNYDQVVQLAQLIGLSPVKTLAQIDDIKQFIDNAVKQAIGS